jgi:hypothetical protein
MQPGGTWEGLGLKTVRSARACARPEDLQKGLRLKTEPDEQPSLPPFGKQSVTQQGLLVGPELAVQCEKRLLDEPGLVALDVSLARPGPGHDTPPR